MRVLLLAPWFRDLAHVHAAALASVGVTTRVVTTASQPYPRDATASELVLPPGLRSPSVVWTFLRAAWQVWRFRPHAVLLDDCWDPRFALLARRCSRRLVLVHDARPHDEAHRDNWWKRLVRARIRRSATRFGVFSAYVAEQMTVEGRPVTHLALPTQFSVLEPVPVPAGVRSGFLFLGRLSPYKGLDFLLRSWALALSDLPADEQMFILASGSGQVDSAERVLVQRGTYDEAQLSDLLGKVRAVILPYAEASQSGVQVLAMQFGVPTVVTSVGALPEMQPAGAPVIRYGDDQGLAQALVALCEPGAYECLSAAARQAYQDHHSKGVVTAKLVTALRELTS